MVTPSETLPENNAEMSWQETHEITQQVGEALVHIRVEAPPGTLVRITVEGQPSRQDAPRTQTTEILTPAARSDHQPRIQERVRQVARKIGDITSSMQARWHWKIRVGDTRRRCAF